MGCKMIKLTESAKNKISNLINKNGEKGVRVGVIGGGCSGFKYHMKSASERSCGPPGAKNITWRGRGGPKRKKSINPPSQ